MKTLDEVINLLGAEVFNYQMGGSMESWSTVHGKLEIVAFIYEVPKAEIVVLVEKKAKEIRTNTFKPRSEK
jgi:hypothetical protein